MTMGWSESIKLNEDVYPRKELVKKWKMYHGSVNTNKQYLENKMC